MKSLSSAKPHAIIVVGVPGSGKTQFASRFAQTFGEPFINAGAIVPLSASIEAGEEIVSMMLDQLALAKQSFLYEPATSSRKSRMEFARWARQSGYEPLIIWPQIDRRTALQRSKKAGLDEAAFDERVATFSPPHASEKPLVISGRHTYASQVKAVLVRLSAHASTRPTISQSR